MSNRTKSLDWWRSLSVKQQAEAVEKWKLIEDSDFKKTWPIELIMRSTSTIEIIWKTLNKLQ
jgi:hypothetical protein